jgi:hypothetical protein
MMIRHLLELGDVGFPDLARRLWIVRQPRRFQPAAHQLQPERLPLVGIAIANRQPPVLDREVVLGNAIGIPQREWIGLDAMLARRFGKSFPARRLELDEGVVEIEGNEVNGPVRCQWCHGQRVARGKESIC